MNASKRFGVGVALLVAVAGTAAPVTAQDTRDANRAREAQPTRVERGSHDFRSAKWMRDRNVYNTNGEEIAEASDYILDRGSGRIDYAILTTGTILGLGGRQVAVPFTSLRWNDAGEHFVMPLTKEQLEDLPEFTEDEWKGVTETGATAKELRRRLMTDAGAAAGDPYAASLDEAKLVRVQGEITDVDRVSRGEYGEHVVLTVKTTEGERKVALGPSWFVNSGPFAPMRGDEVTIEALTIARDPERTVVARSMTIGGRDLTLRDQQGKPAWWLDSDETPERRANAARRYLLLSSILGSKVDCRGAECGRVNDVILERQSGAAAFLSIDPNENFLGIADTKRLVPWSVVMVASDNVVRLDASKEMVLASPETPSDLGTMNSGGLSDQVYKAYEVEAPRFEARRATPVARPATDAWGRSGPILGGIKKDTARTVTGTQREIDEVKLGGSLPSAHAITVRENGNDVLVLLGPSWYVKNQKLGCEDGKNVTIETYRVSIEGKDYLIARSIQCNGSRMVLIDESGAPAWDRN